ncbi:ABC transporter substrate-binding protein [Eubacteriales bacterium OttesenSCG-928-N13]|nr:ABC transporter substrate-binding protein [Eubacteriales bacterium OttesenSCG-928-N13]
MKIDKFLILMLALLLCATSALAKAPEDELHIGVVYPTESIDQDTLFDEGLQLALDQINANGGVLGKQVVLQMRDDNNDITTALQISQTLIDSGIQAVIGHWSSNVCQVVKENYEANKVVMITPAATSMSLLAQPHHYIYRMIPNNEVYAIALADYIKDSGLNNIAIYYSDDVYGLKFANAVEKYLTLHGLNTIDRVTSTTTANADKIKQRWDAFGCEGVVIAAVMPDAANAIHLICDAHENYPVFGAENFDRLSFTREMQNDTSRIHMAAFDLSELDQDFLRAFRAAYDADPDIFAISGYQSLMLLHDAMQATGSEDATAIADYLSTLKDQPSITGPIDYDPATQEFIEHSLMVRTVN